MDQIINTNDTFTINRRDSFSLGDMLGEVPWNFVSYRGSLTTPPCSETVTWLVGMDPIAIEVDDVSNFVDKVVKILNWINLAEVLIQKTVCIQSKQVLS